MRAMVEERQSCAQITLERLGFELYVDFLLTVHQRCFDAMREGRMLITESLCVPPVGKEAASNERVICEYAQVLLCRELRAEGFHVATRWNDDRREPHALVVDVSWAASPEDVPQDESVPESDAVTLRRVHKAVQHETTGKRYAEEWILESALRVCDSLERRLLFQLQAENATVVFDDLEFAELAEIDSGLREWAAGSKSPEAPTIDSMHARLHKEVWLELSARGFVVNTEVIAGTQRLAVRLTPVVETRNPF